MKLMKKKALYSVLCIFPVLLLSLSACGGGGGTETPAANVTGSWHVTETITEASGICAQNIGTVSTWTGDAVQTGNNITVTVTSGDIAGATFAGTISGDHVDWQGTYPGSGGTVTITGTDVTVANTSFSGTSNWEWTDGVDSCSGQTNVTGTKV